VWWGGGGDAWDTREERFPQGMSQDGLRRLEDVTAHRLPRAGDRAACILPRTANPAEGGAAGQDAGAHGLSTRPGPAVLDGRAPLLAQMQAGGRLTPWRGFVDK
ncbi:SSU ribosomal protein S10E, partial [Giardia duodenalis]